MIENPNKNIGRREFISKSTLIAIAVSMPVFSCKDNDTDEPVAEECDATTNDILGPFYKSGSPFRENIIPGENAAPTLILKGKVLDDCDTVLKDAIVEIWNADADGEYDLSEDFKFRGSYKTLENGVYSFHTIMPGRYLNGSAYRPSHIHFRITAPDHQELVSQIYFKDDPYIETDPWAGDPKAAQRILIVSKDSNDIDTVNFDIYLKRLS